MCGPSSSSIALRHCDFKQKTAYEILASLEFRRVLFRSFLRSLPERFGPEADTGLRESGYLLLAGEAGRAVLTANHAVQTEIGRASCRASVEISVAAVSLKKTGTPKLPHPLRSTSRSLRH